MRPYFEWSKKNSPWVSSSSSFRCLSKIYEPLSYLAPASYSWIFSVTSRATNCSKLWLWSYCVPCVLNLLMTKPTNRKNNWVRREWSLFVMDKRDHTIAKDQFTAPIPQLQEVVIQRSQILVGIMCFNFVFHEIEWIAGSKCAQIAFQWEFMEFQMIIKWVWIDFLVATVPN